MWWSGRWRPKGRHFLWARGGCARVNHIEALGGSRARAPATPSGLVRCLWQKRGCAVQPVEIQMTLGTILLIILILLLIGGLPTWGYSRSWGYAPSGGLGVVLIIVIILLAMGRI